MDLTLNPDYEQVFSKQEQDVSSEYALIKEIRIPAMWDLEKVRLNEATAIDYFKGNDVLKRFRDAEQQTAGDFY